MHIWTIEKWKKHFPEDSNRRSGIRFRFDKSVPREVKEGFLRFSKWLRREYYFPLKVNVYVYGSSFVRAKDGDMVVGLFFEPYSYTDEPYIKLAVGDYDDLCLQKGHEKAMLALLGTLVHELTHYFQWINGLELTDVGRERQARQYARFVLDEYREYIGKES